jgi:ABC-type phosphate/phosphonate transport system ATPase subunit
MAVIDGAAKFFEHVVALDKSSIVADLKATYGEEAVIEIYVLKQED